MLNTDQTFKYLKAEISSTPLSSTQGKTTPVGITNSGGEVKLFVDNSGSLGMLVPFGEGERNNFKPDLSGRNLTLKDTSLNGKMVAELKLSEPRLEGVLAVFADEFLKEMAKHPERAVTILSQQLRKWRSLFSVSSVPKLSLESEIGLICELQTLQELVDQEGFDAFDRWTGPDASRHDFQLEDRDIECKATLSHRGLKVGIHGSRQLSPVAERPLSLLVRRYEKTPNGGITLSKLVGQLLQEDEIPTEEFVTKLQKVGFAMSNVDKENENRFVQTGRWMFEVNDDFPRILTEPIPERILDIQYVIDLKPPAEVPGFISGESDC